MVRPASDIFMENHAAEMSNGFAAVSASTVKLIYTGTSSSVTSSDFIPDMPGAPLTRRVKVSEEVSPSVSLAEMVISAEPVIPDAGVTVTKRVSAVPVKEMLPAGTKEMSDESPDTVI